MTTIVQLYLEMGETKDRRAAKLRQGRSHPEYDLSIAAVYAAMAYYYAHHLTKLG